MPRTKPKIASNDLAAVNLSIAKARLAKLESELPPPPTPEYTSYKDLPPLRPEEVDMLKQEFIDLLTVTSEEHQREQYDWYMSMAHLAP